jgi:hypothetical protein
MHGRRPAVDDDIVERLDGCRVPLTVEGDGWVKLLDEAADEIERLRAVGDALVGALENNLMATAVVLVNQWKEARRER